MKRIVFAFGLSLIVFGGLSKSQISAFQDAAQKPAATPQINLPLAPLRREFKTPLPIPAGEKLEYEVRFSRFPIYATVGVVTFEFLGATPAGAADIDGLANNLNIEFKPAAEEQFFHLRAGAVSKGMLITLFDIDVKDRFETLVDAKDFSARVSFKEIKEEKKHAAQATLFDRSEQTIKYTAKDLNNPQAPLKEKSAKREEGMLDLLSAFYFVRLQKLKEGQLIRFPVNDDGNSHWFDVVVGKHEKLKTDCGKVKTIKLEPKLFGPGQLISRQGEMTMWVTDDDKHLPLKLVAKTASGTVNAKLTNFKNNCKLIDDENDRPKKP